LIAPRIAYIISKKYDPYNYPNSIWICRNPEIMYYIPEDIFHEEAIATTEIDGNTVSFTLDTVNFVVEAMNYYDDKRAFTESDLLFTGYISYSEDEFTIKIDKDTDTLFGGKYSKLVFKRDFISTSQ
jgi:hypothetical protein